MSTLAELLPRLTAALPEPAGAAWDADQLTAALRRALAEYSRARPRRLAEALPSAAGSRLVSLAGLSGLQTVLEVHYPYDPLIPAWPPARPAWRLREAATLELLVPEAPRADGTDDVLVFYEAAHTIAGLDGAEETTLEAPGEEVLLVGAAAYAVEGLALALVGRVTVGGAAERYSAWAAGRLACYRQALAEAAALVPAIADPRVPWEGGI
ncbi:MAG: hypothetical protein GX657_17200 [Chloroflexi bacterium]|nr:hypothetical protein [Chloroflexota bacterium]